jgi:DnaJ-class molecular chaperone
MAPQREWFEKDYYRVLGVSDTASQKDIRSAFRKLSRQYHPDANPDDKAAEERFKEVSAAYDVVGDPEKRKEYDEVRKLGPVGGMPADREPGASASRTSATSVTSWVACSAAAAGGVARRAPVACGAPGRTAARTWSRSCTWPSRMRCAG